MTHQTNKFIFAPTTPARFYKTNLCCVCIHSHSPICLFLYNWINRDFDHASLHWEINQISFTIIMTAVILTCKMRKKQSCCLFVYCHTAPTVFGYFPKVLLFLFTLKHDTSIFRFIHSGDRFLRVKRQISMVGELKRREGCISDWDSLVWTWF